MFTLTPYAVKLAHATAQLLFPPTCLGCEQIVAQPATLCGKCWPAVEFIEEPICPIYGTPFSHQLGQKIISAQAIADPPPFNRARSATRYNGVARQMIHALKYNDHTDLAPWMANWMARAGTQLLNDADVIIPVPLHPLRIFQRRFNQAAELARALAQKSQCEYAPQAVIRKRRTKQQVGLNQKQREANMRGAFQVPQEHEIIVHGRHILIIDDAYTTGATVKAMSRALNKAGAQNVDVLTFARVCD